MAVDAAQGCVLDSAALTRRPQCLEALLGGHHWKPRAARDVRLGVESLSGLLIGVASVCLLLDPYVLVARLYLVFIARVGAASRFPRLLRRTAVSERFVQGRHFQQARYSPRRVNAWKTGSSSITTLKDWRW